MKQYQRCRLVVLFFLVFGVVSPAHAQQFAAQADMTQAQTDIQTLKTVTDQLRDQIRALTQSLADKETALNLSISQTPPAGTVVAFAGDAANVPRGWHLCDGADTNTDGKPFNNINFLALWSAIGTANGGDAALKTFHLPDYRGYFLRGVDAGQGRDSNATMQGGRVAASAGGNAGDAVGSTQGDATKRPSIPFKTDVQGNHHHNYDRIQEVISNGNGGTYFWLVKPLVAAPTSDEGAHSHTITDGGDAETRPKNVSVNWIIKLY